MTSIHEVDRPAELREFIRAGREFYRGDPHWVEPLHGEMRDLLTPGRNPFWLHARRALFLARRDGRVVGRVAAIRDDNHNRYWNERAGFFGFFESERDPATAALLLGAAEGWLRLQGAGLSRGPVNPSTNEECGLLVEGFDGPPRIMMTYNPPWYGELIEGAGYGKAMDLLAYDMEVSEAIRGRLARIAARVQRHCPGLEVRHLDMRHLSDEVDSIRAIYNDAWGRNWGFVPMTDAEFDAMAGKLKSMLDPELTAIAFVDGEPAGFLLNLPDYNQVIRGLHGRLTPWGIARMLLAKRRLREMRLITLGVRERFRASGIDACLYLKGLEGSLRRGISRVEFSWILENNSSTRNICENTGGRVYRRYRIYERTLEAR